MKSARRGPWVIGIISMVLGALVLVAGVSTWVLVQTNLSRENITVSEDASMYAGQHVSWPWQAYAQADVINKHALEAANGKTYAELDREDPVRATVMNASFLRASLFTSVIAFGLSAFAAVTGLIWLLMGVALMGLARPEVAPEPVQTGSPAKEE